MTSEVDHADEPENETSKDPNAPTIEQHNKPRAGIAAEYLAKGYLLSDSILQRAIDLDQKQGISKRFLDYFNHIDTTVGKTAFKPKEGETAAPTFTSGAFATVKSVDEQRGISKTATDVSIIASPVPN